MARSESGAAVQAAVPDLTEEQFQEADADQSGDPSEEEFEALTAGQVSMGMRGRSALKQGGPTG